MIEAIRKIYAEELKWPELKDSDDFFDVGGHSLIMAAIQLRIHEELNLEVKMDTLFRYTTVASLSQQI
jgi:acyl carrier protein